MGLVKGFTNAGCNLIACDSEGKTVPKADVKRGYTLVVGYLLSFNIPFPPDILSIALRRSLTSEIVQFLSRQGADVHSTIPNGDTVLHLAIARYPESICLDLVKSFTDASCDPTARDSERKTVLEAAIERGYTSVVEHLLSYHVPFPPDTLLIALQRRCSSQMIELLVRKGAIDAAIVSGFRRDTLLHLES